MQNDAHNPGIMQALAYAFASFAPSSLPFFPGNTDTRRRNG